MELHSSDSDNIYDHRGETKKNQDNSPKISLDNVYAENPMEYDTDQNFEQANSNESHMELHSPHSDDIYDYKGKTKNKGDSVSLFYDGRCSL